jgi:Golgi phosphoprotein 3 (GPP34)
MRAASLRDDVFLLAHDDDGRLLVAEPVISAGLAAAILIDLLLAGRIAVVTGRLDVVDSAITGDPEADATLEAIAVDTGPTGPRAWVSWLSAGSYERTGVLLDAAGVVRRATSRRLGLVPTTRYPPADIEDLVRLRARLRYGVHSAQPLDQATAALCGLVRVLRLDSSLLLSMPSTQLLEALAAKAASCATTIRQVIAAVDAVVTAAAFR